jgi:ATP-dependent helicase HrpB
MQLQSTYPVHEIVHELRDKLVHHPVVILQAPPGAGKSTVLPLELMQAPWLGGKKIIMLEPRRLAARAVATRLAHQLDEQTGATIGYRIRFETKVSEKTTVEVVTEGILTRMIQQDNGLKDVGLLIFDEFHERSLQADLALTLSLQVQQILRPDLRILIMSATLDAKELSSVLNQAPLVTSVGRQFPVDIRYAEQDATTGGVLQAAKAILRAVRNERGDILAFLPGAGEIKRVQEILLQENTAAVIHPLYGDLPFQQQQEAILPRVDGQRKIVLATSIAETSLTIEGIRVVIDAGWARMPRFDPRSGLTRLETMRVTRDAADQRAGRAGRLGPGVCYRLWTEATQRYLQPQRKPEILEADLASLMLELSNWGVKHPKELLWATPPPEGAINQAVALLQQLGAMDEHRQITALGKEMLRLPTHPRMAHMLVTYPIVLAADIAALMEERDPLDKEAGVDITLRVEEITKWRRKESVRADKNSLERIEKIAGQWRKQLGITDDKIRDHYEAGRLLMAAYPERVAQQQGEFSNRYKLANGRIARLPEHDPLIRERWLCIAHLDAGEKEGKIFLAAPLAEEDVMKMAQESDSIYWDAERGMVVAEKVKRIGPLVVVRTPVKKMRDEQRIALLCETIREKGLEMLGWGDTEQQWQARVMSLRLWRTEAWPDASTQALLQTLPEWLGPFLNDVYK